MSNYNSVTLIGRLGADPEIRRGQDGSAYGVIRLATSEKWKDKTTGEKKERTDWHRIKVSGRLAEICQEFLAKGDLALFVGPLRTDKYNDKNGVEKFDTHVRASEMKMLSTPREDAGTRGGGPVQPRGEQPKSGRGTPPPSDTFDDDDIPFITNRGTY
jgi:single-strand DNA-binding protein